MKPSIASIVVAITLAGTFSAHAQNTEQGVAPPKADVAAPKADAARQSGSRHRTRTDRDTDDAAGSAGDVESSLPRLPSVFRNCEEPLPRYCQPYGRLSYWAAPPYPYYGARHHRRHHGA
jgi:hypothetical protein